MEQFPQNMEQNIEYCTCNVLLQFLFPDFAITNDNATAAVQFSHTALHLSQFPLSPARTAKLNFYHWYHETLHCGSHGNITTLLAISLGDPQKLMCGFLQLGCISVTLARLQFRFLVELKHYFNSRSSALLLQEIYF